MNNYKNDRDYIQMGNSLDENRPNEQAYRSRKRRIKVFPFLMLFLVVIVGFSVFNISSAYGDKPDSGAIGEELIVSDVVTPTANRIWSDTFLITQEVNTKGVSVSDEINIKLKADSEVTEPLTNELENPEDFMSKIVSGEIGFVHKSNGSIHNNPDAKKKVALTFDDGPFSKMTGAYLDVLKEYDAKATFFVLGQYVANQPEAAKRIVAEGHELGSHSWYHHNLPKMKLPDMQEDFRKTAQAFKDTVGFEPYLFRAPYGAVNHDIRVLAKDYGQASIMWSIDPVDWKLNSPDKLYNHIMNRVKSGDIILLHENKANTLETLPRLIKGLREKGYEMVTISELIYESVKQESDNITYEVELTNHNGAKAYAY